MMPQQTVLPLLDKDELKEYKPILIDLNNEYLLKLIVERNAARENYSDFQQFTAKLVQELQAKSKELAKNIAKRRNQLEVESHNLL